MVAVDLLLGRRPEEPRPSVIVSIVDATNLDRHLYLTSQLLDLGVPVVVAVNMIDAAAAQGLAINYALLAEKLGVPVVPIQANNGTGIPELTKAIRDAADGGAVPTGPAFPAEFEAVAGQLQKELSDEVPPVLVRRLLIDVGGYVEQWLVERHGERLKALLASARERLAVAGMPVPGVEARTRFGWVRNAVGAAVTKPAVRPVTWTDRIDAILTHRLWGTLVFLAVMFLMFQSIFVAAKPLMEQIGGAQDALAKAVEGAMPSGPLRALVTDGVIKGVGSVLVFLPQILILFLFIAILEDCGYMARAAILMDRVMSRSGLSGKSFIPMLSSVACAIPGIMATRVIENRRDRLATILVAPLMSCSARLPVYILLIGAFVARPGSPAWLPGLVLFAMYMIGFTVAPLVALTLKRTLLRGAPPVFVMELPNYRRPKLGAVLRRMFDAGKAFVIRAGTIILAAMILVWAALYFPYSDANGSFPDRIETAEEAAKPHEERYKELAALQKKAEKEPAEGEERGAISDADKAELERLEPIMAEPDKLNAAWKQQSALGRLGLWMEPVFRPLGWDWKIGVAAMASFPAREVIVGTFGLLYEVGEVDTKAFSDEKSADEAAKEKAAGLTKAVQEEWAKDPIRGKYGVPVALSIMVFFALCCQCAATLVVIWRETKSVLWPAFTFAYMTALAYLGAMATFQVGRLIVG
jgi:ferrous iron transport protein B